MIELMQGKKWKEKKVDGTVSFLFTWETKVFLLHQNGNSSKTNNMQDSRSSFSWYYLFLRINFSSIKQTFPTLSV